MDIQIAAFAAIMPSAAHSSQAHSAQVLTRVFGMEIAIPVHREEAAYGAALFAYQATVPGADIQRFYTYTIETEE